MSCTYSLISVSIDKMIPVVVDGLLDLDPIAGSGVGRTAMIFGDDVPTTSPWDGNDESLSNLLAGNFREE